MTFRSLRRRARYSLSAALGLIAVAVVSGCSLPKIKLAQAGERDEVAVVSDADVSDRVANRAPTKRQAIDGCLAAARQHESQGNWDAAIDQYERARSFEARVPGAAHRLAVLYERKEDRERAGTEYAAAFEENPRDADLWNDFAHFQFAGGDFTKAETAARTALRINPNHPLAWVNLAVSLAEQRRYDEAREALTHAVGPAQAKENLAVIQARHGAVVAAAASPSKPSTSIEKTRPVKAPIVDAVVVTGEVAATGLRQPQTVVDARHDRRRETESKNILPGRTARDPRPEPTLK